VFSWELCSPLVRRRVGPRRDGIGCNCSPLGREALLNRRPPVCRRVGAAAMAASERQPSGNDANVRAGGAVPGRTRNFVRLIKITHPPAGRGHNGWQLAERVAEGLPAVRMEFADDPCAAPGRAVGWPVLRSSRGTPTSL